MAQVYKSAGIAAARVAGEMPEMDSAMNEVEGAVRAEAARHSRTGAFARSIRSGRVKGKKGVTDRLVWSEDSAAWSIEFGHLAGKRGSPNRRPVPGKHVFANAVKRLGGG